MRKLVGLFAAAAVMGAACAGGALAEEHEDEGPTFTFGASTSFGYDFNDPDLDPGNNSLTYSSFEQDESFNIDMVQLGVTGERGAASYGATIDFGDLAAAAGDSADGDVALQTAWLTYAFAEAAAVTAGRFGTPIGYEVLEPWGNAHVSRSWGWSAQPINHDGAKLAGSAGPLELMVGAVNNFTVADPGGNDLDDNKGVVASAGFDASEMLGLYFAGIYTEEDDDIDRIMLNAILSGGVPMSEGSLDYVVEGNWREDDSDTSGTSDLWNVTGYLATSLGRLSLAGRGDYTEDDNIVTGADTSLWSVTMTAGWALVDGLIVRLEYRHDDADEDVFNEDDGADDALDTLQAQLLWMPEI